MARFKCSAPGCGNTSEDKSKSFFAFPREPARCHKWLRFCGLEDRYRSFADIKSNMKICNEHFNVGDYNASSSGTRRFLLHNSAIPSVHSNGTIIPETTFRQSTSHSPTLPPSIASPGQVINFKHKLLRTYARKAKMHKAGPAEDVETDDILTPESCLPLDNSVTSSSPDALPLRQHSVPVPSGSAFSSIGDVQADNSSSPVSCLPLSNYTSSTPTGRILPPRRKLFSSPLASSKTLQYKTMQKKVRALEAKIRILEETGRNTHVGVAQVLKVSKTFLSPALYRLFAAQINLKKVKKNGRRWSEEMKDFSLSLYYHSPKAYGFLKSVFNLPSVRTLKKYQSVVEVNPGLIPSVFETLKNLTDGSWSKKSDKICSLVIDEMSVRQNLHYDPKSDMIIGLADDGKERLPKKGNYCLMALIKGIGKGWKQVIGYWISNGPMSATSLFSIIQLCVSELSSVGFDVKALICDQGANNQGLATKLGISSAKTYFEINGKTINFFFDPPHLMKSIRNNLLKYDLSIDGNIVSWSHIENMYNMNDDPLKVKLLPKLTKQHIHPSMFNRMKVKLATQVFSNSVHVGIHTYVLLGKLPGTAVHTADFVETMDKLFDTFNSINLKEHKYKYSFAMKKNSCHIKFLEDLLAKMLNWRFVNCKRQPACLEGWKISIQSLLRLFHEVSSEYGFSELRTRYLSQDAIENTFSVIRQQHGSNNNPSVQQIGHGLRHLLITSLSKLSPRSNCEKDVEYVLTKLSNISIPVKNVPKPLTDVSFLSTSTLTSDYIFHMDVSNTDLLLPDTGDIEEDNAVYYIAGYICRKFLITHKCSECENILILKDTEKVLSEDHQIFSYFKAYDKDFGGLTLPKEEVFNQVKVWENTFCTHFLQNFHKRNIMSVMRQFMPSTRYFTLCSADKFLEFCNLYLRMRLHWSVRFLNRSDHCDLAGKKKLRILQHK